MAAQAETINSVDEKLCAERMNNHQKQFDVHERRLNDHGDRLDQLERYQERATVQVQQLCEQIKALVKVLYGFLILFVTTLVGFFIWYIQNKT